MAEHWVNLPKEDRFAEDGITKERCGKITLDAIFEKDGSPIAFKVKITPKGSGNAVYSTTEQNRNVNFNNNQRTESLSDATHELLEETIQLTAAGGDEYTIEAKDHHGNKVKADLELETRRKLYYQVIRMKGMAATIPVLTSHLEEEFWNPTPKHYIKLKEIAAKGEMNGLPNFDVWQQPSINTFARRQYNREKDPFCFAVVLVDQLAKSTRRTLEQIGVTTTGPGHKEIVDLPMYKYLWTQLDKPGSPESRWYLSGKFIEDGTLRSTTIDATKVTPVGGPTHVVQVEVDLGHLTPGLQGELHVKVKLVDGWRTGLSSVGTNRIAIATRSKWSPRADNLMKSTLVHEAGHKIGMVPGPTAKGLDEQTPTYYEKNGGHCNHNTDECVMYGEIHAGRKDIFCPVCNKSVRKLDLDASGLAGFQPF